MAGKSKQTLEKVAVAALEDIKAQDIVALDVRKLTTLYDTLVIASAASVRQTKALAQHVRDKLKEAGATIVGVEGEEGGEWVLVDAGDIVVHVMQPAIRAYYNLEELWSPPVPLRMPLKKAAAKTATKVAAKKPVAKKTAVKKAAEKAITKKLTVKKAAVKKTTRKTAGKIVAE
ncbi:MAG: ribosome silencing factor [Proteobacteria bacterium]|nr:ribosome silencing factor [Pseudomonadota bacterium]MCL2309100.1 ribosome silencing factor [Pseudomonadota bacterium]